MGRPSDYSRVIADLICERLAEGESLRAICRDEEMPAISTVMLWAIRHKEFSEQYARAREQQAELYAAELIDIADEEPKHFVPDADGGVSERIDPAGIQRNKLRVDTRKWVASKLLPKKYGEKSAVELSGPDGGSIPVSLEIDL